MATTMARTHAAPGRRVHLTVVDTKETIDRERLERDLVEAALDVRFDDATRAAYSTDASNYRQVPIGVVSPRTTEETVAAIEVCRRHGAPIVCRGGGTSLAGQACNIAVVIDFSKHMNRILEIDPVRRIARVEPGVVLDRLRADAERHGLTFGPDPSTHDRCTLGGMIGNDSCGVHSVMAGRTSANVEELTVVTYRGAEMSVGSATDADSREVIRRLRGLRERYAPSIRARYPRIPRRVSGFGLDALLPENGFHVARSLVGTEGTCVTVLEATVRLVPSPSHRAVVVLGFDDVFAAADHVPELLEARPIGLEGFDDELVEFMKREHLHLCDLSLLPPGHGWLVVEVGAESRVEAKALAERIARSHRSARIHDDPRAQRQVWMIREAGLGATAHVPGQRDSWPGWEDASVSPDRLGAYLRAFKELLVHHGYSASLYGHFGDGCVHCSIDFDLITADGIAKWRAFMREAALLVTAHGGSLSGEHGDGQARGELLPIMFGREVVDAFRAFKAIWDPDGKMNPGKVVDAHRLDEDLRLGPTWRPAQVETHFSFTDDATFARASLRCAGIGLCRKEHGTMCPSYMATRDEIHSTRGRARILFETLAGDSLHGGMREPALKEALDLCLACKACKSECPVRVDMATYKSEFLAHYYRGRLRPLHAYAFGFLDVWARMAERAPALANFFLHGPVFGALSKALLGIDSRRSLPRFASRTFRAWFQGRSPVRRSGPRILLWPDTFNDHFHPDVLIATTRSLEALGYVVDLPPRGLCCGRPLYDFGLLDTAKRRLQRILSSLRSDIANGTILVGVEPSCVSVFRDEMTGLLPGDEDAKRLRSQTVLLSELADRRGIGEAHLEGPAIVHGHCHHKSVLGFDAEARVLERLGLDVTVLDSGCCGMAGAFGFEADHYDVSMKIGERVLFPTVRRAPDDALLVADGFSCRTQIRDGSGRDSLHFAHVLARALGVEVTK
jgi:FAD/FMN-containing dehydrogenase/Fe-S oxidoreductase